MEWLLGYEEIGGGGATKLLEVKWKWKHSVLVSFAIVSQNILRKET